jgi:hypothetical protein
MFSYFKSTHLKVVIARSIQLDIVREIEKKFQNLITISSKDHQPSRAFKLQAKAVLEEIKFSLEKYTFDDDVTDAILEVGDYVVYYVSGYTQKTPSTLMKNIIKSQPYGTTA